MHAGLSTRRDRGERPLLADEGRARLPEPAVHAGGQHDRRRLLAASKLAEASAGRSRPWISSSGALKTGRVTGLVVDKETRAPIAGATVGPSARGGSTIPSTRAPTGRYAGEVDLLPDNAPRQYFVSASAPGVLGADAEPHGYAPTRRPASTSSSLRKCFGTLTGGFVRRRARPRPSRTHGSPSQSTASISGAAGPDGTYRFDLPVPLGFNNQPISYMVCVEPRRSDRRPGRSARSAAVRSRSAASRIGEDLDVTIPVQNATAPSRGTSSTGRRISRWPAPTCRCSGPPSPTAACCRPRRPTRRASTASSGSSSASTVTTAGSKWCSPPRATTGAERSSRTWSRTRRRGRRQALKKRFAVLQRLGHRLRHRAARSRRRTSAASRRPAPTAATGPMSSCQPPNTAVPRGPCAPRRPGYWFQDKTAVVAADTTTTTDFQLVRECPTATIVGKVVNAETQAPISGALLPGSSRRLRDHQRARPLRDDGPARPATTTCRRRSRSRRRPPASSRRRRPSPSSATRRSRSTSATARTPSGRSSAP